MKKLLDHAKQFETNALKISDKITKVTKMSPQNSSETVENETKNTGFDKEIPKERYIALEERQKIIHDLRLL